MRKWVCYLDAKFARTAPLFLKPVPHYGHLELFAEFITPLKRPVISALQKSFVNSQTCSKPS
jgi:hypothetical protein